jgi:hypothetical protein
MALVQSGRLCEDTEFGTRYATHVLYPSSEPVDVFITQWGKGFRVTDGGGAARSVWRHGRDDTALGHGFKKARETFSIDIRDGVIVAETEDEHWLYPAVLAVANASATAALTALEHVAATTEKQLAKAIRRELERVVPPKIIASQWGFRGQSGKLWTVDFAIVGKRTVIIEAISPHHTSISSGYTALADIGEMEDLARFAVYQRELKAEDAALMRQVSMLMPVQSVAPATQRVLANRTLQ